MLEIITNDNSIFHTESGGFIRPYDMVDNSAKILCTDGKYREAVATSAVANLYQATLNDGTTLLVSPNSEFHTKKGWKRASDLVFKDILTYISLSKLPIQDMPQIMYLKDLTDREDCQDDVVVINTRAFATISGYYVRSGSVRAHKCTLGMIKKLPDGVWDILIEDMGLNMAYNKHERMYAIKEPWFADVMQVLYGAEKTNKYIVDDILLRASTRWITNFLSSYLRLSNTKIPMRSLELMNDISFMYKRLDKRATFSYDYNEKKLAIKYTNGTPGTLKRGELKPTTMCYKISIDKMPDGVGLLISGYGVR